MSEHPTTGTPPAPALLPPFEAMTPAQAREAFEVARLANVRPDHPVAAIADLEIPTRRGRIPARLYRDVDGTAPLVVFFHGGGFVLGGIESHDWFCRRAATATGAAVLSVDYGLSPEHPFPQPLDDAWDALEWAHSRADDLGGDPDRLALAGDSAGANLAAATAIRSRDRGGPKLRLQLLVYPMLDCRMDTASYATFADGPFITAAQLRWFWEQYLGTAGWADPLAAPSLTESLHGLPPAVVVSAELDPLRDEAEEYAERLSSSDVDCTLIRGLGQPHGFFGRAHLDPLAASAMDSAFEHAFSRLAAATPPSTPPVTGGSAS